MTRFTRVGLGWVDLDEEVWLRFGYANRADWRQVIIEQNEAFQQRARTELPLAHNVIGATIDGPPELEEGGLAIAFPNVHFDSGGIRVAVTFRETGEGRGPLLAIPPKRFSAGGWRLEDVIWNSLEKLNRFLYREIIGSAT